MSDTQRESETLGVLLIGFNPVVREGLQAILTKDERIEVVGYSRLHHRFVELQVVMEGNRESIIPAPSSGSHLLGSIILMPSTVTMYHHQVP